MDELQRTMTHREFVEWGLFLTLGPTSSRYDPKAFRASLSHLVHRRTP